MLNFDFAFDGKVDMMSLNPLEMTNFEMMGFIFAFGGILLNVIFNKLRKRAFEKGAVAVQKPHHFTSEETDEDALG